MESMRDGIYALVVDVSQRCKNKFVLKYRTKHFPCTCTCTVYILYVCMYMYMYSIHTERSFCQSFILKISRVLK